MIPRLTRMFSRTEQKDLGAVKETHAKGSSFDPGKDGGDGRPPPSRPSLGFSGEKTTHKRPSDTPHPRHNRFEIYPDGSHAHFPELSKPRKKSFEIFCDTPEGGRDHHGTHPQPSPMPFLIERQRSKREPPESDKERDSTGPANLAGKYGKYLEVVGHGASGIVRISHTPDPANADGGELLYAVKEFRRRSEERFEKYQRRLTSEFYISSALQHPNIIHTLDLIQDSKGDFCEVMEYCAGGDLHAFIITAGLLPAAEGDCFFKQLMRGVEYLHEMGVAHRDLKPENLLLTAHGGLKISDFGYALCFRTASETEARMVTGLCGSMPYIAPEAFGTREYDPRAVDVWACGIVYMAMRTGQHLWRIARKDEDEFYQEYLQGRKEEDGYAPIETLQRVNL